jgi:hypothetical protein
MALKFHPAGDQMPPTDKSVSRREFARRIALGAASTSLLPLREFVPVAAKSESPQPTPAAAQTPPSAAKLSPQSQAEAESRFQSIIQQYPDRFSEVQKTDLMRLSVFLQPSLDRIRAYTVSNGDLPALYLKPLVDRDKKPVTATARKSPAPAKP